MCIIPVTLTVMLRPYAHMISSDQLDRILGVLQHENVTLLELVCLLISAPTDSPNLLGPTHAQQYIFCTPTGLNQLFSTLCTAPITRLTVLRMACNVLTYQYLDEISSLMSTSAGFHFNTSHATATSLRNFPVRGWRRHFSRCVHRFRGSSGRF
jgi:hypothetical protein